jgi:hypothetical protein
MLYNGAMTQNASRDSNFVTSKLACLNTDSKQGTNLVKITINASDGGILCDANSTISFPLLPVAPKDANYVNVWLFQGTDGKTYPCVATSSGAILVNT